MARLSGQEWGTLLINSRYCNYTNIYIYINFNTQVYINLDLVSSLNCIQKNTNNNIRCLKSYQTIWYDPKIPKYKGASSMDYRNVDLMH